MEKKPYTLRMGAKLLSNRTHSTEEDVRKAKVLIRSKDTKEIPKILIFDIETAPLRAYVWRLLKNNVNLDHIISEWFCLAWSAKWLYSKEIEKGVLTSEEALKQDDSRIIKDLWKLVNQADIIIAYNGEAFDIPKIKLKVYYKWITSN